MPGDIFKVGLILHYWKSGSTSLVLLRTSSDSGRKCEEWVGNQSAAQWERLLQGEEGNTRLYLYTSTYLPSTLNILPGYDQEPWDVLQLARDGVGFDLQVKIQVVIIFFLALFFHELAQRCSPSWSVWASHPRRLCRLPDALCQVVDQLNCSQHCFFYRASDIWMGEMLQEWWIGGGLEDLHSPPACNWQWEAPTHQVRTKPDRPKFSLYVYFQVPIWVARSCWSGRTGCQKQLHLHWQVWRCKWKVSSELSKFISNQVQVDSPNRHPEQAVDLPVGERRHGKAIFISLLRRLLEFSGNKHLTFTFYKLCNLMMMTVMKYKWNIRLKLWLNSICKIGILKFDGFC